MERSRIIKHPDAILCGDLHLREDTPICRTDDFFSEQWRKMDFICDLQSKYNCVVLCGGDVFHHWKPSPFLLSETIKHLPNMFYTVYGNHDLPQHNMDLSSKSGVYTLLQAGKLDILWQCHYGQKPVPAEELPVQLGFSDPTKEVLVWHIMAYQTPPYPGVIGGNAKQLLKQNPSYSLICTGDNHQSFSTEYQGRLLVNPGNLTRQVADQIDFQPRVALWYAETNTIDWVNIPVKEGVITREHIEIKQQRDSRIDAFISKLDGDWVAGMSFEENLEAFFNKNRTRESVKEIIYKAIE